MKKFFYVVVALLLIIALGIGALLTLVNPNQFKPLISEQVKKATGRDLVIDGDISWRFFPTLGLTVGKTAFRNPNGFTEPDLMKFTDAELSVSVMPLFSHQLEIGKVILNGAHIFIETRKDGVSNLDGLGEASQSPSESSAHSEKSTKTQNDSATKSEQPWAISLAGIEVTNASATINNDQTDSATLLTNLNLNLDRFIPGQWSAMNFDLDGNTNGIGFSAKGKTSFNLSSNYKHIALKDVDFTASAESKTFHIPQLSLSLDHFDFGQWATIKYQTQGSIPNLKFASQGALRLNLDKALTKAEFEQIALTADLSGAMLPRPEMKIALNGDAQYLVAEKLASLSNLKLVVDEVTATGQLSYQASTKPKLQFDLHSPDINVDKWLGMSSKQNATIAQTESKSSQASDVAKGSVSQTKVTEPNLSALKSFDLNGQLAVDKLHAANVNISDVKMQMSILNGVLNLKQLHAKLYGGTVDATAMVDVNPQRAKYRFSPRIKGVQIQPLLKALADNDSLAGTANLDVSLSGQGLSEQSIRQHVYGSVTASINNGALYGVNLPEMIREAKAKLKGKAIDGANAEKKTDFSSLSAAITIKNGVASTSNLAAHSPLFNVSGSGNTNLVSEQIDFTVNALISDHKQANGQLVVPIEIKGNWDKPEYRLDLKQLLLKNNTLKQKAEKEINRGLEKIFGGEGKNEDLKNAADQLLKGLFN
ncbi:TPA: AsmA family protein [Photobacterium damselae]